MQLVQVIIGVSVGGMSIISRLVQIHKMDKRSKLEEEREQQVPSSPTILPASPVPEGMGNSCTSAQFPGGESNTTDLEESITKQRRKSSSNRLQRQEKSVCEGKYNFHLFLLYLVSIFSTLVCLLTSLVGVLCYV